jgi:hypothetical protein
MPDARRRDLHVRDRSTTRPADVLRWQRRDLHRRGASA